MTNENDIVISAFGAVTPLGLSYEEIRDALIYGKSGIKEICKYDTSSFKSKYAGIPQIGNERIRWPYKRNSVVGDILYTQTALEELMTHKGYALSEYQDSRISCFLGVDEPVMDIVQMVKCALDSEFEPTSLEERAAVAAQYFRINDFLRYGPTSAMNQVHRVIGFSGPSFSHVGLCSASLQAIGSGFQSIRDGRADVAIVGGVSAKISPEHYIGLEAADVIATDNGVPPEERSRPFDQWRSGYVPAEGAVLFTLERRGAVEKRGAKPLLEIIGYGRSLNASHIVKPHETSLEMTLSMRRAIEDSGLSPDHINVINAHGTSTQLNDFHESKAINDVFGRNIPVTANKSLHGHMIAAAGAMETLNSLISSQEKFVPATINVSKQDPSCDIEVVTETLKMDEQIILKNSFGMGGLAASAIFRSCH